MNVQQVREDVEKSLGTDGCFNTKSWREWFRTTVDNMMNNDQFHQEVVARSKANAGITVLNSAPKSASASSTAEPTEPKRKGERYQIDFGEEHHEHEDEYEEDGDYAYEEGDYDEEEYEEHHDDAHHDDAHHDGGHYDDEHYDDEHQDDYDDAGGYEEHEDDRYYEDGAEEEEEEYEEEEETVAAYKARMREKRSR